MTFRWARSRRFFFLLFPASPAACAGGVAGPGPLERLAGLPDPAVVLRPGPAASPPWSAGGGGLPGRELRLVGGRLPGEPRLGQGGPAAGRRSAGPSRSRPASAAPGCSAGRARAPRLGPRLPLGLQRRQRRGDPLLAGVRVAGVVVAALPLPEQAVLGLVGLGVAGRHLGREPAQPVLGPVRVLRRVRGDLRPVDRDDPDPPHPQPGAQDQDLREQARRGDGELLPEPGHRHVVGRPPRADHHERHVLAAQPLDPTRRRDPVRVGPDQQRHHHVRVEARRPGPARAAPRVERRGVHQPDRVDHQPHRMTRRQPVPHVRRQQERLITIDRKIILRHNPILSNTLPANPETRHPRSANSATAPPRPEVPTITLVSVQLVARGDSENGVSVPGRRTGGSPSADAVAYAIDPIRDLSATPLTRPPTCCLRHRPGRPPVVALTRPPCCLPTDPAAHLSATPPTRPPTCRLRRRHH